MTLPFAKPPLRKTAHGVSMSDRLSRLYTWLQDNGVGLNDFSTDNCVEREMPKLVALRDELDGLRDRRVVPVDYLNHLAADLHNLMQRTPANRVTR